MLKFKFAEDGTPISELSPGSEKKVVLVCDMCSKETITGFGNYTHGQHPGRKGETFCKSCATKKSGFAKLGKPIKASPKKSRAEKHGAWKGGRFISSDGYVMIYMSPRKYRKEHFLVIEKHLGRLLQDGERVHHIDGDKQNNEGANLDLMISESEHRIAHNSLQNLSYWLTQQGLIGYNRKTKTYMAVGKLRELLEHPEEGNQQPSLGGDSLEGPTTR